MLNHHMPILSPMPLLLLLLPLPLPLPTPAADVNMTASDASMAWQGKMIDLLPFRQPSHGRAMMIMMIHLPIRPPQLPLMPLPFSLLIPPHHLHPHIQPLFPQHQMQLIFSFHLRIPIWLDLMTLMPMPMPYRCRVRCGGHF
jgi:hypothetical protein